MISSCLVLPCLVKNILSKIPSIHSQKRSINYTTALPSTAGMGISRIYPETT
jgi:hypothetical protein